MTDELGNTYAVIKDTQYYDGDVQNPLGFALEIAKIYDETGEEVCVGALYECRKWKDDLDSQRHYLNHGEASYHYRIAKVLDYDIDYQVWLDSRDWDGCPTGDYDANCAWAELQAYKSNDIVPVEDPYRRYQCNGGKILISLAEIEF